MSTLQSLVALVALIFALSVIVQAIQEFVKNLLDMKANAMAQAIKKFMGDYLPVKQVTDALGLRGLDLTALENFNAQDFRHLLDGLPFERDKLKGLVASADAGLDQIKDNIAASYEGARALFQKIYAKNNKYIAMGLSLLVVAILNANVILLYENVAADPAAQQAIMSKVQTLANEQVNASGSPAAQQQALQDAYKASRDRIAGALQAEPLLGRTAQYAEDFSGHPFLEPLGLLLMAALVSLGAPFWNDVLKGATGLNNALNGNGKKTR
jgi:hypothetical protein